MRVFFPAIRARRTIRPWRCRSLGIPIYRCASTSQTPNETNAESAAKETPPENEPFADDAEDTTPPPRRYGFLLGGVAVAAVAGVAYGVYSSNMLSSYVIASLRSSGPNFLDGDLNALEVLITNPNFREILCADPSVLSVLVSALNPDYSIVVQRRAAMILAALTADAECVEKVLDMTGVAVSLYYAAMGASSPEVSLYAFTALKPLVAIVDNENATRTRNDLITVGALSGLSRASRLTSSPEVAMYANDVLANMLPFVTDIKRIKLSAMETNNLLSAAVQIGAMWAEQSQPVAAIAAYRVAVAIDPNHPHILTSLAVELAKSGAVDESIHYLSKAVSLDANLIEANFHRLKIAAQRRDAKTGEYIKSLRRALINVPVTNTDDVHPLLGASYLLLIQSLESSGRLDTAIECAYEWTLRSPADALPYFTYGRLLLADKLTDSAVAALTFADARDPSKAAVKYHLAIAMLKRKDLQKAKQYVDDAFRCTDMSSAATIAGLHYIRARIALSESDYATAIAHLNKHITLAPQHPRAFIDKIRATKLATNGAADASDVYSIWNDFMEKCGDALTAPSAAQHKTVTAELTRFSDECSSAANAPAAQTCAEMKSACQRLAELQRASKTKQLV